MIVKLQWAAWERLARIGNVASKDGARPVLTGIYFEADERRLRAVATDSYKLATVVVDAEIDEGGPILLPARQVRVVTSAFRQLADAQFDFNWKHTVDAEIDLVDPPGEDPEILVEFSVGDRYVGSLTIDQIFYTKNEVKFPKYRALLHKPDQQPFSRSTLARKRKDEIADYIAAQYGRTYDPEQSSKETLLNIYDDFAAKAIDRSIGLNPDHLNALMRTTKIEYQPLRIEMFGAERPIFCTNPSDKDWQGIQMPVRST